MLTPYSSLPGKFAESLLSRKLEDALENKRQTENFIDMTSHVRNLMGGRIYCDLRPYFETYAQPTWRLLETLADPSVHKI